METKPQTTDLVIKCPVNINKKHVQEALVAVLYNNGELSSKEACHIATLTRRDFEERVLPQFGFSILRDTQENIRIELNA
ncbi:MAG: hypothetical protein GY786_06725 [Proteobacteria bacterium]|nr:hypothetical protein [Pseudomonadota bacterium]